MKILVGIALALGLVGVVLGVVALRDGDAGSVVFTRSTLELTGAEPDTRISYPAEGIAKDHPNGNLVEVRNSAVTGDAEGEYIRTCTPVVDDEIECNGAFQLAEGSIEIETTAHDDPNEATATAAIVGGTGAYEGALGSVEVNFEENTYLLHLLLPTG
ncbi:MAG: hypothetical protein Q7L55_00895 [Actinomycetota bacterium]|nr:hypothetical protein [Actinomycetota bacterium]